MTLGRDCHVCSLDFRNYYYCCNNDLLLFSPDISVLSVRRTDSGQCQGGGERFHSFWRDSVDRRVDDQMRRFIVSDRRVVVHTHWRGTENKRSVVRQIVNGLSTDQSCRLICWVSNRFVIIQRGTIVTIIVIIQYEIDDCKYLLENFCPMHWIRRTTIFMTTDRIMLAAVS